MVYDKLKGMIADQLGVSEDEVKPEARLKEDLKADRCLHQQIFTSSFPHFPSIYD